LIDIGVGDDGTS